MNGLPISLPSGRTSVFDSGESRISMAGAAPDDAARRQVRASADLDTVIRPDGSGRFRLPPLRGSGGAKFAGLKLSGALDVTLIGYLSLRGSKAETRFSEVNVSVKLPNFLADLEGRPLQGTIRLITSNTRGFELDKADIAVPAALFGPVAVRDLFFKYPRAGELLQTGAISGSPRLTINASPPPEDAALASPAGASRTPAGWASTPRARRSSPASGSTPGRLVRGQPDPPDCGGRDHGRGRVRHRRLAVRRAGEARPPYSIPAGLAPPGLEFLEGRRVDSFSLGVGGRASLLVPALGRVPLANGYVFYASPDYFEFGGGMDFRPRC